ncbi:MAG: ABC transporter substrate-binding protein [Brevinema sp.]
MKNLGIVFVFLMFISCGNNSGKTIVRYMYWDNTYSDAAKQMKKEFEEANPDIRISLEVSPWNQYWTKLEAATLGKDMPDVFWINFPQFPKFYDANLFYNWNNEYEGLTDIVTSYPQAIKNVYCRDGGYVAFPKGADTTGIYINKKIFQDAGVPLPSTNWTYTEFTNTLVLLKTKLPTNIYPLLMVQTEQGGFEYFVYNNGGYIVSPDGTQHGLRMPGTLLGLEEYKKIMLSDWTPSYTSLQETPVSQLFLSGYGAILTHLSVWIKRFADNPELISNIVTYPYPTINGQNRVVLQSVGDGIAYNSKNIEAAKKWVQFMNSPRGLEIQSQIGIFFPLVEPYTSQFASTFGVSMAPFLDYNNTYSYPSTLNFSKYYTLYNRAIRLTIENNTSIATELSNILPEVDILFAK